MTYDEFKDIVKDNGFELKEWAELIGMKYSGVTKWNYVGVPEWVNSWFKMYVEKKKVDETKKDIIELVKKLEGL